MCGIIAFLSILLCVCELCLFLSRFNSNFISWWKYQQRPPAQARAHSEMRSSYAHHNLHNAIQTSTRNQELTHTHAHKHWMWNHVECVSVGRLVAPIAISDSLSPVRTFRITIFRPLRGECRVVWKRSCQLSWRFDLQDALLLVFFLLHFAITTNRFMVHP